MQLPQRQTVLLSTLLVLLSVGISYAAPGEPQQNNVPVPNDPFYMDGRQYNIQAVNAHLAWTTQVSITAKIGIADSGIDQSNSDVFAPSGCRDFTVMPNSPTCMDENGHGSHVASTICSRTNNGHNIAGLAWSCPEVVVAKVTNKYGNGNSLQLSDAIDWLADQPGMRIINLSLETHYQSAVQPQALSDSINRALAKGILIVAAAGNEGTNEGYNVPAQFPGVIAVAALDAQGKRASYSNYGDWISISAPGDSICANWLQDQVVCMSGTSMATPHVTAGLGLLLSKSPCMSADEAKAALAASATPLTETGLGAGLINFDALLSHAKVCQPATPKLDKLTYVSLIAR
jgi:thermitase